MQGDHPETINSPLNLPPAKPQINKPRYKEPEPVRNDSRAIIPYTKPKNIVVETKPIVTNENKKDVRKVAQNKTKNSNNATYKRDDYIANRMRSLQRRM